MKRLAAALLWVAAFGCADDAALERFALECDGGVCADAAMSSGVAYRVTEARLLDPHLYADPVLFGCTDVTDRAPAGRKSANETIAESLSEDTDGDGSVDFGVLVELRPDDPDADGGRLIVSRALCRAEDRSRCEIDPDAAPVATSFDNLIEECLAPDSDVLSPVEYRPPVPLVEPTCFVSRPIVLPFDVGDTSFTLRDARVAGQYGDGRIEGLLIGFVTLSGAREAMVKRKPLATYLPGGDDVCAEHDDSDVHDGERGWWFHIEYLAEPVELVPPPPPVVEERGGGCGR